MTRSLARLALCALALYLVADLRRHRRRRHDHSMHHEALMTWEDEGGAMPIGPATESATRSYAYAH